MDRARGPVGPGPQRRVTASRPDELEAITDLVHDAYYDDDAIVFDERERTLTIPFEQEDEAREVEPPWELLRSTRWYVEYRVPFYAGRLTIHHVTEFRGTEDSDAPGQLVEIRYDGALGRVTIDAWDEMHVSVGRLEVTAELTDRPTRNMRRRTYRLLNLERDEIM